MEKLIAMVICTILVVALVGCSTSKDGNNGKWNKFLFNQQCGCC